MQLLVTGVNGFVGSWISAVLAADPRWQHIHLLPADGLELLDRAALTALLAERRPDAVLHLASQSSVAESIRDPQATMQVNVIGTLNLLDALEANAFAGRLLFVGSSEEYGLVAPTQLPVAEDAPLAPRNPYAVSKAAGEMLVLERVRRGRIDALCTRSFNHTGPRQDGRFVLPALVRQVTEIALGRRAAEILAGDLDITRDFIDVRDAITAYLLLLHQGASGTVYNVCGGREYRLSDLLGELLQLAGVNASVGRSPDLLRPAEQRRICGDNTRLRELGWTPAHTMTQTLAAMLDDCRATLEKEEQ